MYYKYELTPSLATKISQQQTDKHFEVTDSVMVGFKLKRYTSDTMTFSLMYTAPDGHRLRYTMGNDPAPSVPVARKMAEKLYAQVKLGGDPAEIDVKTFKARWGSCSAKGKLDFNWKILMAPNRIVDYVVIHELCHIKQERKVATSHTKRTRNSRGYLAALAHFDLT